MWLILSALCLTQQVTKQQTRYLMGTVFSVEVPFETSDQLIESAFKAAVSLEKLGTTYNPESPLMLLRNADARFFDQSSSAQAQLLEHLEHAIHFAQISNCAFHPATSIRPFPDLGAMRHAITQARKGYLKPIGWDLGGMLKGTAIDAMIDIFKQHDVPWALVNGGGDMRWYGKSQKIMIRKPGDSEENVALFFVQLESGALATSANDRRFTRTYDGVEGHIRFSGRGFSEQIEQVSVLATTAESADAWATAQFVGGPRHAREWCESYGLSAALVTLDGELLLIGDKQHAFTYP